MDQAACYYNVARSERGLLRTTMSFFTSGTPSDFGSMLPLVPVVKILKKNLGHRENLGESGGQTFKGSDQEKCQF